MTFHRDMSDSNACSGKNNCITRVITSQEDNKNALYVVVEPFRAQKNIIEATIETQTYTVALN